MNEKQRTAVIGAIAVLVLGVGAISMFRKSPPEETVGVARRGDRGGAGPVDSSVAVDPRKLYQGILDVDPFRPRLFTVKRTKGGGRDPGDEDRTPPGKGTGPPPGYIAVRLTCIESTKQGAEGLLEERETGKGMFVKKGQKIGECTIADVTTYALLVEYANAIATTGSNTTTKKIEFGDRLDLKQVDVALSGLLKDLGPIKSSTAAVGSEGWGGQPPLSAERAKDVLAELRAKRRKSLGLPEETPPPPDKPADAPKQDPNTSDTKPKDGPK